MAVAAALAAAEGTAAAPAPTVLLAPPVSLPAAPMVLSEASATVPPGGNPLTDRMVYAREVHDPSIAPQHPGDATPRLLLLQGTVGDYARGRLLFSPWTAFKGVFPMHGTYFAQNEVFEDESAGEVRLPLASLGRERRVFLGRSIEGVLRRRSAPELATLFRHSFVCIRRFRSSDLRLLPLLLEPPLLLKNKAAPSALALHLGLTKLVPLAPAAQPPTSAAAKEVLLADEPSAMDVEEEAGEDARDDATDGTGAARAAYSADRIGGGAPNPTDLTNGLRLFALYVAAGGALCMRPAVWRKLMAVLHPDKGGDVRVFQHVSSLKARLDAGEDIGPCQPATALQSSAPGGAVVGTPSLADELYARLRAELKEVAQRVGGQALKAVEVL